MSEKTEQEILDDLDKLSKQMEEVVKFDGMRVDRSYSSKCDYDDGGYYIVKGGEYFPPEVLMMYQMDKKRKEQKEQNNKTKMSKKTIEVILDEQKEEKKSWYDKNVAVTSDLETINGYQLYDCFFNIFNEHQFLELYSIWKKHKVYTFEEFEELCYDTMCTDWYKMDRNGECFEGFWKYPEGSEEKNNALQLTGKDNIKGLFELPYPKDFILETIKIGCRNRQECVRYSNFLCVWFERKIGLCRDELEKLG